jgi:hypothetical protein
VIITIAGADPPVAGVTGKVAALVPTPPEVVVTTTGPADGPGGDTVHVTSDGEIHTMGAHTWPATLTDEISPGPEPKLEPVIVICVDWPAGKVPGSTARITGTGTGAAEGTAEGTAEGATEGATVPLDEPTRGRHLACHLRGADAGKRGARHIDIGVGDIDGEEIRGPARAIQP